MSGLKSNGTPTAPDVPSISVVVPLYNHAQYIEAALESVLSQTSLADEIILIDDGSSDDGFELAERLLADAPYAKTYRQESAGAHNTIDRAIAMSRGDYIAILNSDDVFVPTKLERCRTIIGERPGIGLIADNLGIVNADGMREISGGVVDWLNGAQRLLGHAFAVTRVAKRELRCNDVEYGFYPRTVACR
jgi:glycosyltransferase involved in cell wall biosynthesis